jgi:hypothetical protein
VLLLRDIDVVHFAVLQLAVEHILCIFLLTSVVLLSVSTVEPWIASIIRSRNVLVIQNTRISK